MVIHSGRTWPPLRLSRITGKAFGIYLQRVFVVRLGQWQKHLTTGLAYKQLKLNRMSKTIKRLLRPLFLLFIFDIWWFFLMLLWSPVNAAGAPLLYYDLLITQPAFNQCIGHLHPTTCGWNFGRLHGSTFVEGENPLSARCPNKNLNADGPQIAFRSAWWDKEYSLTATGR